MSDQQPAAPTAAPAQPADTPSPAVPDTGTHGAPQSPEVNFEQRYNDLRSQFDRTTPLAKNWERLQNDPDFQSQVLQELGYEIDGGDPDPNPQEFLDPSDQRVAQLEAELAEMRAWRGQQDQQAQLEALEAHVEGQLSQIPGLEDSDKDWIVARAVALPPAEDGTPDIGTAYEEFQALEQAMQKRWVQSKRTSHVSAVGQPGTQTPNLDDDQQRVAYMAERLRDLNDAS